MVGIVEKLERNGLSKSLNYQNMLIRIQIRG